jgi:hypothetical protein
MKAEFKGIKWELSVDEFLQLANKMPEIFGESENKTLKLDTENSLQQTEQVNYIPFSKKRYIQRKNKRRRYSQIDIDKIWLMNMQRYKRKRIAKDFGRSIHGIDQVIHQIKKGRYKVNPNGAKDGI